MNKLYEAFDKGDITKNQAQQDSINMDLLTRIQRIENELARMDALKKGVLEQMMARKCTTKKIYYLAVYKQSIDGVRECSGLFDNKEALLRKGWGEKDIVKVEVEE